MSDFRITPHVPIPKPRAKRGTVYPWPQMTVGDSIFVREHAKAAANAAGAWGRKYGRTFTARAEGGGKRIWRVA